MIYKYFNSIIRILIILFISLSFFSSAFALNSPNSNDAKQSITSKYENEYQNVNNLSKKDIIQNVYSFVLFSVNHMITWIIWTLFTLFILLSFSFVGIQKLSNQMTLTYTKEMVIGVFLMFREGTYYIIICLGLLFWIPYLFFPLGRILLGNDWAFSSSIAFYAFSPLMFWSIVILTVITLPLRLIFNIENNRILKIAFNICCLFSYFLFTLGIMTTSITISKVLS